MDTFTKAIAFFAVIALAIGLFAAYWFASMFFGWVIGVVAVIGVLAACLLLVRLTETGAVCLLVFMFFIEAISMSTKGHR